MIEVEFNDAAIRRAFHSLAQVVSQPDSPHFPDYHL